MGGPMAANLVKAGLDVAGSDVVPAALERFSAAGGKPTSGVPEAIAGKDVGFAMLDAPVSGGVGGATAATLTFMVGGEAAAFERARPILEKLGKTIVHAG